MIGTRYLPLIARQVLRHRTRSLLTIAGVAIAMLVYCAVEAMQRGVKDATGAAAAETTLIVYRENRYCPFSSKLPEHYESRILKIPHVTSALPMKIVVNNCRAGLDVVTFRGVPQAKVDLLELRLLSGTFESWRSRGDAALVGRALASRKSLRAGDSFDAAGVTVFVAGIVDSDDAQDQNVAYVGLDFLQRASTRGGQGIVTQFIVTIDDPARLESVAKAIDDEFRTDQDPTYTSPERAFIARAAHDVIEIVSFTRWLGWGCLAAVLGLVANAIVLSLHDRIKEHAILQTLGFRPGLITRLVVVEALALSLIGGVLGALAAAAILRIGQFTLTVEGVSIAASTSPAIIAWGVLVSAALGAAAALVPAWRASRREITECFRAV